MQEKDTGELEEILGKTHISQYDDYVSSNKDSLITEVNSFYSYVRERIKEKGLNQQTVFLKADIPERYGYKLLSGEKRTRQRDVILRICYSAEFSLAEVQRALRKYEMPELYAKDARDALIMMAFNERPGSIIDVNELLKSNNLQPLRTSGIQE